MTFFVSKAGRQKVDTLTFYIKKGTKRDYLESYHRKRTCKDQKEYNLFVIVVQNSHYL